MFVDDIKLFKPVATSNDCYDLQSDVEKLRQWSTPNDLAKNAKKCYLTFHKIQMPFVFDYYLDNCQVAKSR